MARKKAAKVGLEKRTLDARPDTVDFRDRMFVPTLTEVPKRIKLDDYRKAGTPILDQGQEGSCTGFGLATVCHYLLRTQHLDPDATQVSPRMLYEMAKRYDEWPGEAYAGSSARGAMKGWHKHGVCSERLWPYRAGTRDRRLTPERASDAVNRPLGAYFRVNHKDLVAMHCAMAEVGILYATAVVHAGWDRVDGKGRIPLSPEAVGGHAFAIVAYDEEGLWIQNSWDDTWGLDGFARISYDDWLENGTDVWVARLAVPVRLRTALAAAAANADTATAATAYSFYDLRPHIVSIGNDGRLRETGTYGTSEESLRAVFKEDFPAITQGWKKKRLLLYAHGGLTSEKSAVQRVADYRTPLLDANVYPLAFVWKSDMWTTLTNILRDALTRRRAEGLLDASKDFMLDRLDDALEPLARFLGGKTLWDEMKENATLATTAEKGEGGAYKTAQFLKDLLKQEPDIELHVVGHSAGAVFHASLVQLLATKGKITSGPMKGETGLGLPIATCTLWAPACTVDLFKETYVPVIESGGLEKFAMFTLTDSTERDDHCANIYHKSLLYLVSNAFEARARVPLIQDGVPILGMAKFVAEDTALQALFKDKAKSADWVLSPNTAAEGSPRRSDSRRHGDFDDDLSTLQATFARILGSSRVRTRPVVHTSASKRQDTRRALESRRPML